ncbi:MAG: PorV/PorQ family protein [Ignavibacteriales bacterium]|nr:PorV/PorQ family protein [Ignavibacteriales bacterium]
MKNKIFTIFLIGFLLITQFANAQIESDQIGYKTDASKRGSNAAAMLGIGIGARAEALGGAFVAIADDPSALYWNPAGITQIKSISLQVTKTDWFVDTDFSSLDFVVPLPSFGSALGFHLAMLDYGDNPVRTIFRPEGNGETYSASDFVAGLYLAMAITDRVSASVGAKYFRQSIWHVSGSVIGFDMSILFQTPVRGLKLGGTISNLGPEFGLTGRDLTGIIDIDGRKDIYLNNDNVPISLSTETYALPLLFRFGAAYEYEFDESNSFTFASNLNHPSNNVETVDLGFEAKVFDSFYLRGGYQSLFSETAENGLTLGAGINYRILDIATFIVDYSWSDWGLLTSVNRFSIGISAY